MNSIEELLKEVKDISQRYAEIAKITGDNYNVFEILGIRSDEDSHSRILTNILDPKGIHDCGDVFLKLFFEKFLPDVIVNDFSKCKVYKERYIGDLGRIDIYIDCQNFGVIIENKIYAEDQDKQLERYDEFLKERYEDNKEKYRLFYLTLDGRKASKESHCNIEYMRLAYSKATDAIENESDSESESDNSKLIDNDILSWLKCCQEKVFNKPLMRETLEQYINLIKILTGQTRRIIMSEDILKVLAKNAENIKAAFEIGENLRTLKLQKRLISENLVKPLIEWAAREQDDLQLEIKTEIETENVWRKWFKVITVEKKEWYDQNFRIGFEFGGNIGTFQNLYYGLTFTKDWPIKKNPEIVEKLGYAQNSWYWVDTFNEYNNWNGDVFAKLIEPNNAIVDSFIKKIEKLLDFLKSKKLI